jgi:hypothetical protein
MPIRVWSVAAAVLLLAACGGPKPEVSGQGTKSGSPPDISNIKISGDASAPVNKIAIHAIADLEQYWGEQYPKLYNSDWEPVSGGYYAVTEDSEAPPCTTEPTEVAGNSVASLLATQWGLAALTRLGDESDEKTSTLRGDCLAGGYTASVILYNRPETSTYQISPGDLDEAITALLVFRGEGDVERQGAGWARVKAFREGVINGAQACLEYQA